MAKGMARRKPETWHTGCLPFSVVRQGRAGEPKWFGLIEEGKEVTGGKIKAAGGKGNEISASPQPSADISNCRHSATPLRFPRQERRNCSMRKAVVVVVAGGGVSGRCCLLQEWLCLLPAPSSAEVVGRFPCHSDAIRVGCRVLRCRCRGIGRDGRGQALLQVCARCFCILWTAVPGCRARLPIPCRHGCLLPSSIWQPSHLPGSLAPSGKRCLGCRAGKIVKKSHTFHKTGRGIDERAQICVPAAGKAAAEGATPLLDIGACTGDRPPGKNRRRSPNPFPAPLS